MHLESNMFGGNRLIKRPNVVRPGVPILRLMQGAGVMGGERAFMLWWTRLHMRLLNYLQLIARHPVWYTEVSD